jgi:YggT family protein
MTVSSLVAALAQFLTLAIIVRAVLSWFPANRTLAPVTAVLNEATDPLLNPIRRRLPLLGGFDLSPLIAIVLIGVIESVVLSLLARH